MSKKIVIDARLYNQSGIGRYTRTLITELQEIDKENQYFILLQKSEYDSIEFKNNFKKVLANFPWYGFSEQYRMPKLLNSLKPDLVHFPHFNVPIFYGGKFVVTIHDLIHQHFAMTRASTHGSTIYKVKQFGYNNVFRVAVGRSKKILVPSENVKNFLHKDWSVKDEKIIVTPEAVDAKFMRVARGMSKQAALNITNNFGIKNPYLFYLGNAHPHKNVEGLINTFLNLQKKYKKLNLVLAGQDHYFWQQIKDKFVNVKGVIFTGFVTDEEAIALYKNAVCFVMPSFEEGFGIPILEAFACECPVVSSNKGSLSEVGGDAALYFDPDISCHSERSEESVNCNCMETQIEKVIKSETLRQDLIAKGKIRVKDFSWKRLAQQTLEVYKQSFQNSKGGL